ncbi:hypothetical protein HDE_02233 [Halotydeus destructor]|nr:hypothetical protein HDE_02233 [Halotydeus destructor]
MNLSQAFFSSLISVTLLQTVIGQDKPYPWEDDYDSAIRADDEPILRPMPAEPTTVETPVTTTLAPTTPAPVAPPTTTTSTPATTTRATRAPRVTTQITQRPSLATTTRAPQRALMAAIEQLCSNQRTFLLRKICYRNYQRLNDVGMVANLLLRFLL